MDYNMAIEYIETKNKLGIVPGLACVKELLRRLGNPQNKIRCLHIAGTNGKGSIFSFVENILLCEGYRVGRYVSPTIFTYLERFQIDKCKMEESEFADLIERVIVCIDEMEEDGFDSPTAFEIETAVAFLYFYEKRVDYALIECGMGGELDATNVIDNPLACVMASVSLDHMQILGDTIEKIARTKAGIVKKYSMLISYPQEASVAKLLKDICCEQEADYYPVEKNDVDIISINKNESLFSYKGKNYAIHLLGEYQIYNAATAILLVDMINKSSGYVAVSEESVSKGLKATTWAGRMTRIHDKPLIYVDGAHNEKAWIELRNTVNKYFTNTQIIYIMGVLRDKEYSKMVDILLPTMNEVIAVTPNNSRGLDKDILAQLIRAKNVKCETADSCKKAMDRALLKASVEDVIIVCGSLSFLSEYLLFFK